MGEHVFGILVSLIGLLFTCMFCLIGWMFKVSSDVNKRISEVCACIALHHENAKIHGNVADMTSRRECSALHGGLKAMMGTVKEDTVEMKADIKTLLAG